MKNTITISVQDDFWENRAHGDTTFPIIPMPIPTIYAGTGTKNMNYPLSEAAPVRYRSEPTT